MRSLSWTKSISILIDEARTPLIISGPLDDKADLYNAVDKLIPDLVAEDFELDEKQRQVSLTETGNERMEQMLSEAGPLREGSLYDVENVTIVHHVNQALKAHKLFQRDKDYIVKSGEVIIIDEFTGRMMPGRRYSEGLHQALEAKEHVEIQPENQTLASITFQNYFRLYDKLAGMTGTASTEAQEFGDIYGLEVIEIPTNLPVSRLDEDDEIYRTQKEKYDAIVATIADAHRKSQPCLVGTTSIEKSEQLSELLKDKTYIAELGKRFKDQAQRFTSAKESEIKAYFEDIGSYLSDTAAKVKSGDPIPHQVLNARFHEQEASIVAQAGVPGAVTIATNMAGRGTDIQLGGNVDYRIRDWVKEEKAAGREPDEAAIAASARRHRRGRGRKEEACAGCRRPVRDRHGAAREPAHRQSAARPVRPAGRSGPLEILSGARRRPDAHLRLGQDGEHPEDPGSAGGRGHHASVDEQVAGDGAEEGRGAQLRHSQADSEVRRRDERPAQGHLRSAHRHHGGGRRFRDREGAAPSGGRRTWFPSTFRRRPTPSNGTPKTLAEAISGIFDLDLPIPDWAAEEGIADQEIQERLLKAVDKRAAEKEAELGPDLYRQIEKEVLLRTLDGLWREHIVSLEHLRQVIGFRAYGQRDPLNEYKSEAFTLFESSAGAPARGGDGSAHARRARTGRRTADAAARELPPMEAHHIDATTGRDELADIPEELRDEIRMIDKAIAARGRGGAAVAEAPKRMPLQTRKAEGDTDPSSPASWGKVARNAPCPCGSGKKYKQCHGKFD